MDQQQRADNQPRHRHRRRRDRRHTKASVHIQPTSPRWSKESGPKTCRKCGGRMYPADWIWQQYGLCLGWRCSQCKEKVLARSLPFKGLRKRKPDPDEIRDRVEAEGQNPQPESPPHIPAGKQRRNKGNQQRPEGEPRTVVCQE